MSAERSRARLLLVDNRDSFTYNLVHLFGMLGADVTVVRSDATGLNPAAVRAAQGVVIGPGPGRPRAAGRTLDAVGWALDGDGVRCWAFASARKRLASTLAAASITRRG